MQILITAAQNSATFQPLTVHPLRNRNPFDILQDLSDRLNGATVTAIEIDTDTKEATLLKLSSRYRLTDEPTDLQRDRALAFATGDDLD